MNLMENLPEWKTASYGLSKQSEYRQIVFSSSVANVTFARFIYYYSAGKYRSVGPVGRVLA